MESPSDEPQIIESPEEAVQIIEDAKLFEDPQRIESARDEPQMIESPIDAVQIIEEPQMIDDPQIIESPDDDPQMMDCPAVLPGESNASRAFGSVGALPFPTKIKLPHSLSAPIAVAGRSRPSGIRADANTFVSPAPAPINPAVDMNELPSSRAVRSSIGVEFDRRSSSNAAAPLTIPAAMLVPDNWMTAWVPMPAT